MAQATGGDGTPQGVIICGASVAGLSAAFWFGRLGWSVTVLERAPGFRGGGQNVDVRGTAREVVERMGLAEAVRSHTTTEEGTLFLDERGRRVAAFPASDTGSTAELEILRGDLAQVLLDALPGSVEIVYDETVATVRDDGSSVHVETRSGRSLDAELLVVAEGVGSATRDRLFHDVVTRRELRIDMAFGTIERVPDDDRNWRWFNAPGGRQVHLRPDNHGTTRAMLACSTEEDLAAVELPEALRRLRRRYAGAGWQTPRILDGFDASDDVYVDHLTQIRASTWHRGRVCLLGDAAWCVTPMGGGGCSLALIGAYVLVAMVSQGGPERLETSLRRYEDWMRPLIDNAQKLPPGIDRLAYPRTRLGVQALRLGVRAAAALLFSLGGDGIAVAKIPLPKIEACPQYNPVGEFLRYLARENVRRATQIYVLHKSINAESVSSERL